MVALRCPEVFQEAEHEVGRAAASAIARLPCWDGCGIISKQ